MNPAPPKMYYVYLLKSDKNDICYIGCTSNLEKRLREHYLGKSFSTKRYLPMRLVYYEAYCLKEEAYNREGKLKQYGSSLQKLKKRLERSLNGGAG